MERFIRTSPAAAIAARLMGSRTVRLYHDHVLVKEPGTRQRTPWHQDLPYYNVEGRQNVSMWFPVDPVSRSATLEFVAGSHLGPWYMPRTFLDGEAKWFPEGALADLPDVDGEPDRFRVIGWELEPGDAVFFDMLTLHAAGGVDGPNRRRVLSLRFLGDDMVHAPRRWTTSPPFPGLEDELPAGAPLDHPLFPLLWDEESGDVTVRDIVTVGHPVLRERAREIAPDELGSPAVQCLIDDLIDTMRHANGAGLAANQIGVPQRVAVIEVGDNPRYPYKPRIPLTIVVNPVIEPLDDELVEINEGCLSVPNLRGNLQRHVNVRVRYLDRHGVAHDEVKRGLTAGTFQHECDHLDGVLFLDRVTDPRSFTTWEQFERFHRAAFVERITRFVERVGS